MNRCRPDVRAGVMARPRAPRSSRRRRCRPRLSGPFAWSRAHAVSTRRLSRRNPRAPGATARALGRADTVEPARRSPLSEVLTGSTTNLRRRFLCCRLLGLGEEGRVALADATSPVAASEFISKRQAGSRTGTTSRASVASRAAWAVSRGRGARGLHVPGRGLVGRGAASVGARARARCALAVAGGP